MAHGVSCTTGITFDGASFCEEGFFKFLGVFIIFSMYILFPYCHCGYDINTSSLQYFWMHATYFSEAGERNQCGIFRKMLKRGTIVSATVIDIVADLWKVLGPLSFS